MNKKLHPKPWISTVRQMRAINSPVRHQIHLAMEMLGPCSVRVLAERLAREPATLYYQVKIMERAGILVKCTEHADGGKREVIYELAEKCVRVDMNQRNPRFVEALAGGFGALLRFAERTLVAALRTDSSTKTGKASQLRIRQATVRLTTKSLIELNSRLDDLQGFLDEADTPRAKTAYAITLCVAPTLESYKGS